jgi:hypothetical protein
VSALVLTAKQRRHLGVHVGDVLRVDPRLFRQGGSPFRVTVMKALGSEIAARHSTKTARMVNGDERLLPTGVLFYGKNSGYVLQEEAWRLNVRFPAETPFHRGRITRESRSANLDRRLLRYFRRYGRRTTQTLDTLRAAGFVHPDAEVQQGIARLIARQKLRVMPRSGGWRLATDLGESFEGVLDA